MEQTAAPGTVQISDNTQRLVAPIFDFADLGLVEVKGKADPVRTYAVLAEKSARGSLRGIQGLDSPVVGRDEEIGLLHQALEALRTGQGAVISLIGEAGLGKSRLVAEMRAEVNNRKDADGIHWLEGRSFSYETTSPYAPFIDVLSNDFGFTPEMDEPGRYSAIRTRIETLAPGQEAEIAPFLASLIGILPTGEDFQRVKYLEPPALRGNIFQAVSRYLALLADRSPIILVLDDIHWIDPTSLDLLNSLLPLAEHLPLLILVLFRPNRQEPGWDFHLVAGEHFPSIYRSIQLQPLGKDHARSLVANLLHVEDLPEKVRLLILEKAEGNPFFVEEVIRSLLDSGLVVNRDGHWFATREIENIAVPDTLSAVITTRLDRLVEADKQVLQTASVIGRDFTQPVLEDVLPRREYIPQLSAHLDTLQQRELLRRKGQIPVPAYAFKHALTQETAYSSLLLKDRRMLHLRVADCLERNFPERVADIARHYLEARETVRALPYLVESADRAARAYASQEAFRAYQQVLELAQDPNHVDLQRRAYEGLGNLYNLAGRIPEAVETYEEMNARAKTLGDHAMEVSALNKLALITALYAGQFEEAEKYLNESDRIARENQDKTGISELSLVRCMMCTAAADFEGVVRYMDETVALGKELGIKEQMVEGFEHIAGSQVWMTLFDEAHKNAQEGLALAREIGDRLHEAGLLTSEALYFVSRGEFARAGQEIEEALAIGEAIGSPVRRIMASWIQGYIARLQGDYEQALETLHLGLKIGEPLRDYFPFAIAGMNGLLAGVYSELGPRFSAEADSARAEIRSLLPNPVTIMGVGMIYAELASILLAEGRLAEAEELLKGGLELPSLHKMMETPRNLASQARLALLKGDLPAAEQKVREAANFAADRKLHYQVPGVQLAAGRVALAAGRTTDALSEFEQAAKKAAAIGLRPVLWQALAGQAQVLAALGETETARSVTEAGRLVIEEIAADLPDSETRAAYLAHAGRILAATAS